MAGREVLLVGLLMCGAAACGDSSTEGVGSVGGTSTDGVVTGAVVPPALTEQATLAWSGSQALVIGGDVLGGGRTELGLFEPATATWSTLADPPWEHPLFSPAVAWSGDAFVVLGVACSSWEPGSVSIACSPGTVVAASYAPDTDTWAALEPPIAPSGSEIELWLSATSSNRSVFRLGPVLLILDHASMAWTVLDEPFPEASTECLVDDQLVSIGGDLNPPPPTAQAYSFVSRQWTASAQLQSALPVWGYACGVDGPWAISVGGGAGSAAVFTSEGSFEERPAPALPSGVVRSVRSTVTMLVHDASGTIGTYLEQEGRWIVADPPGGNVVAFDLISDHEAVVLIEPEEGSEAPEDGAVSLEVISVGA